MLISSQEVLIRSWGDRRSRVTVTLGTMSAGEGCRSWCIRLADGESHLEWPLNVQTRPGLALLTQTQEAVLSVAGAMLKNLGAEPVTADGVPLPKRPPAADVTVTVGHAVCPELAKPRSRGA